MSLESWQYKAEEIDEAKSIGARIGVADVSKNKVSPSRRDGALRHGSGKTFNLIKPRKRRRDNAIDTRLRAPKEIISYP